MIARIPYARTVAGHAFKIVACLALLTAASAFGADKLPPPQIKGVLYLTNGDHAAGHLADSTDKNHLGWQSPLCQDPFRFSLNAVTSVSFPTPEETPRPQGTFCFELADGNVLFGSLVSLEGDEAVIDAPGFGKLHVQRNLLRRMCRWDGADVLYVGPGGLDGWHSAGGAWREDAGHLVADQAGATLRRNVNAPGQACFEIELAWTGRPDFELALGVDASPQSAGTAFRFEIWQNELVLLRETDREADVVGLHKIEPTAMRLQLQAFLDQEKGRMLVYSSTGQPLGDVTVTASKPAVLGGVRLVNKSGNIRLERLCVRKWGGEMPRAVEADKSRIRQADGTQAYGRLKAYNPQAHEFVLQDNSTDQRIAETNVQEVYFAEQGAIPPRRLRAALFNGTRFSGELLKVEDGAVWMRSPGIAEPLRLPGVALNSMSMSQTPTVKIMASDGNAAEGANNKGRISFQRNNSAGELTVHYTLSGSATNGKDYQQLPSSVKFPVGDEIATIEIEPLDDTDSENSETVVVTLEPREDYLLDGPHVASITIADNDMSFATDPQWTGSHNNDHGNKFGWSTDKSFATGRPGSVGGTFARSQNDCYYADTNLGTTFTLDTAITASGQFTVGNMTRGWAGTGDSGFFVGHFSKDPARKEFIGIEFKESGNPEVIRVRARYQLPGMSGADSPIILVPMNQAKNFSYNYDPAGGPNGRIAYRIQDQVAFIDLSPIERDSAPQFDAFGIGYTDNLCSENDPAKTVELQLDAINYSRGSAVQYDKAVALQGREGRLEIEGTLLHGFLANGQESDASCLVWHPRHSSAASALKHGVSARIIYRDPPPVVQPQVNNAQLRGAGGRFGVQRVVNGRVVMVQQQPDAVVESPSQATVPPGMAVLHLRTGDTIPCKVTAIDERGVSFEAALTDATFVPNDQIKVLELMPEARPVAITKVKKSRLLTLPRMQRGSPPTQLIRSTDGDYLRGRLLAMDDRDLQVEMRLETRKVPRDRVARIIWLHADEVETDKPKPAPKEDINVTRVQSQPIGGNRLTFVADRVEASTLYGHSELLRNCKVDLSTVDQLLIGSAIDQVASTLTFHQWKMTASLDPLEAPDGESSGEGLESALVGKPAPEFELDLVGGKKVRLADFKNKKILILDFWASWCAPCLQAMPQVDAVAREFADKDVALVAINLQEGPDQIKAALQRLGLETTVAMDREGLVSERYGATAIPQTVIIDREGKVVRLFVGGGPRFGDQLREALQAVVDPKAAKEGDQDGPPKEARNAKNSDDTLTKPSDEQAYRPPGVVKEEAPRAEPKVKDDEPAAAPAEVNAPAEVKAPVEVNAPVEDVFGLSS